MAVVLDFNGGIDPADHLNLFLLAVSAMDDQGQVLPRFDGLAKAENVERFVAAQAECLSCGAVLELAGQDAHANQVGAMNPFKALGDHRFHAEQARAFGGPIA